MKDTDGDAILSRKHCRYPISGPTQQVSNADRVDRCIVWGPRGDKFKSFNEPRKSETQASATSTHNLAGATPRRPNAVKSPAGCGRCVHTPSYSLTTRTHCSNNKGGSVDTKRIIKDLKFVGKRSHRSHLVWSQTAVDILVKEHK
eukprot:COSAG02_NODE_229_length_28128_cov_18.529131_23_plen_145_part_00